MWFASLIINFAFSIIFYLQVNNSRFFLLCSLLWAKRVQKKKASKSSRRSAPKKKFLGDGWSRTSSIPQAIYQKLGRPCPHKGSPYWSELAADKSCELYRWATSPRRHWITYPKNSYLDVFYTERNSLNWIGISLRKGFRAGASGALQPWSTFSQTRFRWNDEIDFLLIRKSQP